MEDTLFVVGNKCHIWHRSVIGVWSNHSIGGMGSDDYLFSVHGVNNNEVYAVGFRWYLEVYIQNNWYYKWNGVSWNVWTDAPSVPWGYGPICIYCVASDDIYVGIRKQSTTWGAYIIHWNGSTWTTIIPETDDFRAYAIWAKSSTEVYFAGRGDNDHVAVLKKWNGSSVSTSTTTPSGLQLGHLGGSADGTLFFCGPETSNYGIYRGIWDSFNLDPISNINCGDPYNQYSQNAYSYNGKAWIFGVSPTDNKISRVAIYDGDSWSIITLKSDIQYFNIGVAGIGNNVIAVYQGYASADARAFIWDGFNWSEEVIGDGGSFLPRDAWKTSVVNIDSIDPSVISQDGGSEIIATGLFPTNNELEIHLGFNGSTNDPLCYGGQGYKTSPISQDGTTLKFYSPHYNPMEKGELKLTIVYDDFPYIFGSLITLIERSFKNKQFSIYSSFPPLIDTGKRLRDKERM